MNNKFDFNVADELCKTILNVSDVMESENERVQKAFSNLHETFRDKAYDEFQADFNAADRSMAIIINDLRELHRSLSDYKERLIELL